MLIEGVNWPVHDIFFQWAVADLALSENWPV
jgi:hypothetical protein